ncbi:heterodisulfide reductase-related iron-sulfur binding cluster, partial [Chloroflexota bacterium]
TKGIELARSRSTSFCCGGGGGHMWMEEEPDKRVNVRRVEEIIGAEVELVATACPYCLTMFEDALKAKEVEESIKAMDLSELVVEALE